MSSGSSDETPPSPVIAEKGSPPRRRLPPPPEIAPKPNIPVLKKADSALGFSRAGVEPVKKKSGELCN